MGKELKEIIIKSGYTDKQIARMFGTSLTTARRWRIGDNKPHPVMEEFVLKALEKVEEENERPN